MLKAILFDLDGTLLAVNNDFFFGPYMREISEALPGVDPALLGTAIIDILKELMEQNPVSETVGEAFMRMLGERIGQTVEEMMPHLDAYYAEGFPLLGRTIQPKTEVRQALEAAKTKGYTLVLATNPVFPAVATRERMRWAGLSEEDFALVTYFDHCSHTKPHQAYYTEEILGPLGLAPEECLMVGNDVAEDMAPTHALGMSTYLVTEHILGDRDADFWDDEGNYLDLLKTIESLPDAPAE